MAPLGPETLARILTPADEIAVKHGCRFDPAAAAHVSEFFETFLHHSKGRWAGKAFRLLPWQRTQLLEPLFGWKGADGTRRFRKAYVEIAKKNGKSTLCSGLALYLLVADGEPGAEVYCAAYDRKQAAIVFGEAARMTRKSPALAKRLRVIDSTSHIVFDATGSKLATLSKDSGSSEGLNVHGLVFDELHTQKTRALWDALKYGGISRNQPLQVAITTAGWDRESICYEVREYARAVRAGEIEDPSFFSLIFSAAETDEAAAKLVVTDAAAWARANPSLGETMTADDMARDAKEAVTVPRALNTFKRYRLNIWTEGVERWISDELWSPCQDPAGPGPVTDPAAWREAKLAELAGRECFGGLDLGASNDLSSFVLIFKGGSQQQDEQDEAAPIDESRLAEIRAASEEGSAPSDNAIKVVAQKVTARQRMRAYSVTLLPFFWLPEETAAHRKPAVRAMYDDWCARGFITRTEGDTTDHDRVRRDINALRERFSVHSTGIDRDRYGVLLCTYLQGDGAEMVPTGQGFRSMGTACWEWEDRILARRLTHGANPVLTWMMRNTVVKEDEAGNLKPVKPSRNSHLKIDGVVAGLMALLRASETAETGSVYERRGLIGV